MKPAIDTERVIVGRISILYVNCFTGMGGGEFSLLHLMENLDRKRFEPILVTPSEGPLTERAASLGIKTIVVPFPVVPLRSLANPRVLFRLVRAAFALRDALAPVRFDIIQCSDILSLALLLPTLLRRMTPVVFSVIFFYERLRAALLNLFAPFCIRTIVVNSRAVASGLQSMTAGLEKKIAVCYNGVDADIFRPLTGDERRRMLEKFSLPAEETLIGFIGRYDLWKGHLTFLAAAEKLAQHHPECAFLIAGGAPTGAMLPEVQRYREQVRERAGALLDRRALTILDHCDDIPGLMGCLDLFVCPSDREPYGLVVLEAYSAGVPVIASNTVGALEILPGAEYLSIARPGDPDSFSTAMIEALKDRPDTAARSRMNERMREVTWAGYSQAFAEIYVKCLK